MSVATIEVNISALGHNIDCLKKQAPSSQILAIVKANAYGHGNIEVARCLQKQVDGFGVARLTEALALRHAGITLPIILLEGFFPDEDIQLLEQYNLQAVIHSPEQIERLSTFKSNTLLTVWFKIDSGMHRLGFRPEEAKHYFNLLTACSCIEKPINLASHFCCADELANDYTAMQIKAVDSLIASITDKSLLGLQSLAASGAIFAWPSAHRDLIRPGIALYGVSPFSYHELGKATGTQLGLQPVMTLKSELIAVRKHKKGEGVGYSQIWQSSRDTQLGVVAFGYGDGYPRNIPPNIPVMVGGKCYPIVGHIAMDMIVIDLGPDTHAKVGDEVIFWGPTLPVEKIAALTGISAYELLTRLTSRAQIQYRF